MPSADASRVATCRHPAHASAAMTLLARTRFADLPPPIRSLARSRRRLAPRPRVAPVAPPRCRRWSDGGDDVDNVGWPAGQWHRGRGGDDPVDTSRLTLRRAPSRSCAKRGTLRAAAAPGTTSTRRRRLRRSSSVRRTTVPPPTPTPTPPTTTPPTPRDQTRRWQTLRRCADTPRPRAARCRALSAHPVPTPPRASRRAARSGRAFRFSRSSLCASFVDGPNELGAACGEARG